MRGYSAYQFVIRYVSVLNVHGEYRTESAVSERNFGIGINHGIIPFRFETVDHAVSVCHGHSYGIAVVVFEEKFAAAQIEVAVAEIVYALRGFDGNFYADELFILHVDAVNAAVGVTVLNVSNGHGLLSYDVGVVTRTHSLGYRNPILGIVGIVENEIGIVGP